jgi:hypothetical protein
MKTADLNFLESSDVTLSAGTAHADYPLYRLYDRHIGRDFMTTAAETTEVKIDQGGAAPFSADTLIIPAGHNLDGMTLDIKHSDDDAVYTPAVPQWVQSGSGVIDRSWTSVSKRYWKFIITNPSVAPRFAELFLTEAWTWLREPAKPQGPVEDLLNMENTVTSGGQDRFIVNGPARRQRVYRVLRAPEAQKQAKLKMDRTRPFWLHDGTEWIYGKLRSPLNMTMVAYQRYSYLFDFLEVLP